MDNFFFIVDYTIIVFNVISAKTKEKKEEMEQCVGKIYNSVII